MRILLEGLSTKIGAVPTKATTPLLNISPQPQDLKLSDIFL